MILYFADRTLKIIGVASDSLASGVLVSDDTLTENVDSASDQFDFSMEYDYENRSDAEDMSLAGNYLFRDDGERIRLFTIIETEQDIAEQRISCYAEGIGLDFINDVKEKHEASAAHPIEWYFAQFCQDLEIRDNESTAQLKLSFEEQTLSERLNNLAEAFGVELSFDFEIENFRLKSRIVDIVNAVGTDRGEVVSLYTNLSDITVKRSIANLATALRVSGADNTDLNGYTPPVDSDFTLSGTTLMSGVALETWERAGGAGHICRSFTGKTNASDAAGKAALYLEAKEALIKAREPELNYEIKLTELPPDTKLGDVVNIVDDAGNLYVSSRLLELKTSITGQSVEATVGDFLIKESGISAKVEEMASEFARIADLRQFYTWVAYADDASGLNISLSPANKAYMGIKENQTVELTELSQITDPLILKWSKVEGDGGEDGTTFTPSVSSAGVISWTNDGGKVNPPSQNIKGQDGTDGKSAYEAAIEGGLPVSTTESQFNTDLAEVPNKADQDEVDLLAQAVETATENITAINTEIGDPGDTPSASGSLYARTKNAANRITSVESDIDDLDERTTDAESAITGLDNRIAAAEGSITTAERNITSIGTRVTTAEGKITVVEDDVDDLESRTTAAEADITTIEGNVTSIGNRVTAAEAGITSIGTRLTTAEGKITSAEGRIDAAESSITSIEEDVDDLEDRTTAAEGSITTIEGNITSIGTRVTTAEGNITAAEGRITTVEGDITDLEGRTAQAEEDIEQIESLAQEAKEDAEDAAEAATRAGNSASVAQYAAEAAIESNYKNYNSLNMTSAQIETRCALGHSESWARGSSTEYYQGACAEGEVLIIYVTNTSVSPNTRHRLLARVTTASSAGAATTAKVISFSDNLTAHFWHDENGAHIQSSAGYRTDLKDGMEIVKTSNGKLLLDINSDGVTFYTDNSENTQIAHLGFGADSEAPHLPETSSYYDLGIRDPETDPSGLSLVEGYHCSAGYCGHAEGDSTSAGSYDHAEGINTVASGTESGGAHAEGGDTKALGEYCHAEGYHTTARSAYSHAEGLYSEAASHGAHAEGQHSFAKRYSPEMFGGSLPISVRGSYNYIAYPNPYNPNSPYSTDHVDIVGIGTSDNDRKNGYALDDSGNGYFAGDVYAGCDDDSSGGTKLSKEGHTHDDRYYTETEVNTLLAGKSSTSHTHDNRYYTETEIDTKLSGKSDTSHNHDSRYYTESEIDTKLSGKSDSGHTHDDRYYRESEVDTLLNAKSDNGHTHDSRYYTESEVNTLLAGKSATGHTHDDRYYTESEIDTKLSGKSNTGHTHTKSEITNFAHTHTKSDITDFSHDHDDTYQKILTAGEGISMDASNNISANFSDLLDFFYPVGTIYESLDSSFDPATAWGGTWEKIQGRFLLGSSSSYSVGGTGGSANAIVVSHSHGTGDSTNTSFINMKGSACSRRNVGSSGKGYVWATDSTSSYDAMTSRGSTGSAGSSGTGANMPPYKVVNIWQRTA